MSATATDTPPAAKPAKPVAAAATPAPSFEKIAKEGKPDLLKVREVHVFKKLQARDDTDQGSTVDEARCVEFAAVLEKIQKDPRAKKFPPIKVMKVTDAPGHKNEEIYVCMDGMHTLRGHELAKIAEIDALVWSGTWAQAQFFAATRANREHAANGKPLSTRDKIRAVTILGAAYKNSDVPKKDWPTNRAAADMAGCSRQLVNEMDPFERGKGDVRAETAAKKRAKRDGDGGVNWDHWEVVQKSTGQVVAAYDAIDANAAWAVYVAAHALNHTDADQSKDVLRKQAAPAAAPPGSAKPTGFDWAGMDAHLGYLIRGVDGMGDIFGIKGTAEHKQLTDILNQFATAFQAARAKHGKKKQMAS